MKIIYCLKVYYLLYQLKEKMRVCFFINKAMVLDSWEYKYLSLDVFLLFIKISAGLIIIINIYNPC